MYKKVENSGDLDRTEYFYYNSKWQLLEIAGGDNKARQQFVWGTQYIDEAICMDVDTDSDGDCTDLTDTSVNPAGGARRFFYCQDANYNVIALREGATIVERYEYDAYGVCRVYKGWDSVAAGENLAVIGDSLFGNPIRYAGYFWDNETGLYYVRHRMYDPRTGVWNQRECSYRPVSDTAWILLQWTPAPNTPPSIGPDDTINPYLYAMANPANTVDPSGHGIGGWFKRWTCLVSAACAGAGVISCGILCADGSGWSSPADGFARCFNRCLAEIPNAAPCISAACTATLAACGLFQIDTPPPRRPPPYRYVPNPWWG